MTEAPARPAPLAPAAAAAVVFGAAAAVLILEILALRMLAPYVGLTLETSTTVIGVVLAGIAAGSALGGIWADLGNPRAILAWALIAGGLLAMLTVPLVRLLGEMFEGGGDLAALPVALFAFFPPALVLSVVTPATAKIQLGSLASTGRVVGRLSAWATAGALVGTFTAGFVLVPLFPTSGTVLGVGAALLVAGLLAAARARVAGAGGQAAAILLALTILSGTLALDDRCDAESVYYCAQVRVDESRPSGRSLILDDLYHSYVDLEDPRYLGLAYARWIAPALDNVAAGARDVDAVFVGGGGLTLPRYLRAVRPGARARVLEVDSQLVDLVRERLGFRDAPWIEIRIGDARQTLRDEPTASADVVVGDAFGGRAVPWHLTTREFIRDIRRVLRPRGVYALNLIDHRPLKLARAEAATLLSEFRDVALVTEADGEGTLLGGNVVMLAADERLPADVLPRPSERVAVLDRDAVRAFAGDSDILTDEHAPADQLLTPRS